MVGKICEIDGPDIAKSLQNIPDARHGLLDIFFKLYRRRQMMVPTQERPAERLNIHGILGMRQQRLEEDRLLRLGAPDPLEAVVLFEGDADAFVLYGIRKRYLGWFVEFIVHLGAVAVDKVDCAAIVEAEVDVAVEHRRAIRVEPF